MKCFTKKFLVLILLITVCGFSLAADWQEVVPGIDYRYYRFESPQNDLFVTRLNRTSTSVIIDASLANGKITQPGVGYNAETIPSQVSRYDGAFGFWGRETGRYRYNVIAAINGSGFGTANGCPDSAMVMNGALIKRTFYSSSSETGAMGFLYKIGSSAPTPGTPYMADEMRLPPDPTKCRISFSDSSWLQFHKINDQPVSDKIILYTHHYGTRTPAATNVTEIVVKTDNAQPLRIMPWTNYTVGYVTEIKKNSSGETVIPFDCIVIVASGNKISDIESKISSVGDEVRFSVETKDTSGLDWTNLYAGIGPMWGVILKNSVKPSTTSDSYHVAVHPRTAAAFSGDYIYFIVVDGRSTRSTGMTLSELADFCVNSLGATDAVNNDGGGSSTIWVDGEVKNVPSDGNPRAVASGLMMIQLKDKEYRENYSPDETTGVKIAANLYTGPGINFHSIISLSAGTPLSIVDNDLNGIRTQDINGTPSYWWKVKTSTDVEGWISSVYLNSATSIESWYLY
jgi:exopolysaccharide biosynthesis protein